MGEQIILSYLDRTTIVGNFNSKVLSKPPKKALFLHTKIYPLF